VYIEPQETQAKINYCRKNLTNPIYFCVLNVSVVGLFAAGIPPGFLAFYYW
jgi:hypothetical protein